MIFTRKKAPAKPPAAKPKPRPEPTQEELLAEALRPGRQVCLAVAADLVSDRIDVRPSMVHDIVKGGLLILAQTNPPLAKRAEGQTVEITFLIPHPDRGAEYLRLGYKTKILRVIDGWKVDERLTDNIIVAPKPHRLERTTLRLHYRVEPTSEAPLRLLLAPDGPELVLLDISVGGARFNHHRNLALEHDQVIDLLLETENLSLGLRARVVRTSRDGATSPRAPTTTAVQFVETTPEAKTCLGRLVNEIARRQRARDAGLLDE